MHWLARRLGCASALLALILSLPALAWWEALGQDDEPPRNVQAWGQVEGEIYTQSGPASSGRSANGPYPWPYKYFYVVEGRNHRVDCRTNPAGHEGKVTVYYDARDPQRSTLETPEQSIEHLHRRNGLKLRILVWQVAMLLALVLAWFWVPPMFSGSRRKEVIGAWQEGKDSFN